MSVSGQALAAGHLHPVPTTGQRLSDGRAQFLVRVVDNLARKAEAVPPAPAGNPFLPYDPAMFVADISPTYVCLLNKFNVVEHHVLLVTRHFESQETSLTQEDLRALWICMAEYDALGFYNSGTVAGASQPHKHLQLVALPLDADAPPVAPVPLEPLWQAAKLREGEVGMSPELPFRHLVARLGPDDWRDPAQAAEQAGQLYWRMVRACGGSGISTATPYNLLVTRTAMLFVPRRQECFEGMSLNAMAFAGALLVKTPQQLARLASVGPMSALAAVAQPR